jgi:lysophospholipase L1-like esterase
VSSTSSIGSAASAPPKSGWRRLGKSAFWFVFVCLFLEIALRAFGYGSYVIYRPDQRLLWVPIPGANRVTEINHEPETISPQGFRYKQTLTLQHPGVYRIFTFGDSTTMGWGVSNEATYSAQLEKLLSSQACSGLKFQVISAGVNAYPNALAVERLTKVLEDGYQPNAVILAYSANTGFEGIPDLQGAQRLSFLERVRYKSIARRSALYNFLIEGVLREIVYYRLRYMLMLGTWNTVKAAPDLPASHFLAALKRAKEATDARHVQLIFMLLGSVGETGPAHPYQKAMLDFAEENNIPLVNIIDLMRTQDPKSVFMDHVHPTAAGHLLIAQQLAPVVRSLDSYAGACHE